MMITGPIQKSRMPARRLNLANAAIAHAARDFRLAWIPDESIEVSAAGTYAGRPVVTVRFGGRDYILGHEDRAHLAAQTARLLQVVATQGNTQWPSIPGTGTLTPTVANGRAIWAKPSGDEFCEIGHLFAREVAQR